MSNIFARGVQVNNGIPSQPSLSFLNDNTTGIYLDSNNQGIQSCGVSVKGETVALFGIDNIQLLQNLQITDNAANKAVLTSDQNGNAAWRINNQHGSFRWNSIYSGLDVTTQNNQQDLVFAQPLDSTPTVNVTKESNYIIDNFDFYVKNKSQTGVSIYSNSFMYKTLITGNTGDYSTCRLSNGNIGIAYYNIDLDRMQYIYSTDYTHSVFSTPIIIDNISAIGQVSLCMVGTIPAIAYIADNDDNDEWRYVLANDINGASWKTPVIICTSTIDITFLPVSLFLRIVSGNPVLFISNETGHAQMYRSKDISGILWNTVVSISNLTNHQILDVQVINGYPAVIAKSNIINNLYYVQSNSTIGATWPIGATQIYKTAGAPLYTNDGKCCNFMGIVNGNLTIIASELHTNDLYMATAMDINGTSWGSYQYLTSTNTTNAYPRIFQNNSMSYLIYNNTTGTPSEKRLIAFAADNTTTITSNFISTLSLCGDNQVILNLRDNNNIIILASSGKISLIKFYGNDFYINWSAIV